MAIQKKTARAFSISLSLLSGFLLLNSQLSANSQGVATTNFSANFAPDLTPVSGPGGKSISSANGSGSLVAMLPNGARKGVCPLKHTDVKAQISGYVARVSVKQTFQNTFKDKIEAIYTFPLPENAAVDEMTMRIGNRTIKGTIKKREEARQIYEAARAAGQVASLLDQERPNIFTQSVANIEPGATVEIEIKYVDLLPYESGSFSFVFPTVVGPRFIPGKENNDRARTGRILNTELVPDASKLTPKVAPEGQRAGHDISIDVDIASGVPINEVKSALHEVKVSQPDQMDARVTLASKDTIPNKDFVLSWNVAKDSLQSGYLTHRDQKSGYFTLMLMPPKKVTPETAAPKEMVFLVDCSGSQHGAPIEKAKETIDYILDHMNPNDTLQVLAFNNGVTQLSPVPQKATDDMREKAKRWVDSLTARGGTFMAPAVEKVLQMPADENRLRVVVFMTDGYVGNDFEIRSLIRKYRGNARWFPFGTGNSVNRFLIDGIAKDGGGEAEYVLLKSPGSVVGEKFYKRISSPVLTDVKLEFDGLNVKEVYPVEASDVWAERPLYFKGRYLTPGAGTITLTGLAGGKPYKQDLKVVFPEKQDGNAVIKSIWARAKVDRLMSENWMGIQHGSLINELKDEIISTALDYHLMTQYTSFVAVEEKQDAKTGKLITVPVDVEMPDGVSRETTVGRSGGQSHSSGGVQRSYYKAKFGANGMIPPPPALVQSYAGYGGAGGAPASGQDRHGVRYIGYGGGGLPPTNMGKFVHQPGDSIYSAPSKEGLRRKDSASSKSPTLLKYGTTDSSTAPATLSEEKKPAEKLQLTHPSKGSDNKVDGLLRQLMSAGAAGANEIAGLDIVDGKVAVKITLSDCSEKVLEALKSLGFTMTKKTDKTVLGRIQILKLQKLIEMTEISRVQATTLDG